MHEHLRAWRKHRGLTLTQVAASMGRSHTTVSRWESGEMPLKLNDLSRLALIYCATVPQLSASPSQAELVAKLDEIQKIVERLDAETLEHWLGTGRRLAQNSKPDC